MAQKIIICEGEIGKDLTQSQPLAGFIADGFEVTQVNGYTTRENRHMCVVLLAEPATQTSENNAEQQNDAEPQGGTEQQGDSEQQGDTEQGDTDQQGETTP